MSMNRIFDRLLEFLSEHAVPKRIIVAVSGGLDSMVLMHVVAQLKSVASYTDVDLGVLHINHQLSPHSIDWQRHVELAAQTLSLRYIVKTVTLENTQNNLESHARSARYAVFEQYAEPGTLILTAHHASDQAETILYRMARGSGIGGLSAIPAYRALSDGTIGRPFLSMTRSELEAYAHERSITYVNDESNGDIHFDRNYLRHQVLPVLKARWPNIESKLADLSANLGREYRLLNEYAALDLEHLKPAAERGGYSLDIGALTILSSARRYQVIRYWLSCLGELMPSRRVIEQLDIFWQSADDRQPQLQLGKGSLRRFKKRLYYLLPMPSFEASQTVAVVKTEALTPLPAGGVLSWRSAAIGLDSSLSYEIRYRRGGERCHPSGRDKPQSLKKLMQEFSLEPWHRARVPLLYHEHKLVAVAGLWVDKAYVCPDSAYAKFPLWLYSPESV